MTITHTLVDRCPDVRGILKLLLGLPPSGLADLGILESPNIAGAAPKYISSWVAQYQITQVLAIVHAHPAGLETSQPIPGSTQTTPPLRGCKGRELVAQLDNNQHLANHQLEFWLKEHVLADSYLQCRVLGDMLDRLLPGHLEFGVAIQNQASMRFLLQGIKRPTRPWLWVEPQILANGEYAQLNPKIAGSDIEHLLELNEAASENAAKLAKKLDCEHGQNPDFLFFNLTLFPPETLQEVVQKTGLGGGKPDQYFSVFCSNPLDPNDSVYQFEVGLEHLLHDCKEGPCLTRLGIIGWSPEDTAAILKRLHMSPTFLLLSQHDNWVNKEVAEIVVATRPY
jgi:hypothetical protein